MKEKRKRKIEDQQEAGKINRNTEREAESEASKLGDHVRHPLIIGRYKTIHPRWLLKYFSFCLGKVILIGV